jgi:capsular exopolysaccharide synthesis family protein
MREIHLEPITNHPAVEGPASESDFDITEVFEMVRRNQRLLVLAAILGIASGLVLYFNTPDSYSARTRIQIERRSSSPLGNNAYWMQPWWNPEFYPTQHEILKSRGLALRVVDDMRIWEDNRFNRGGGGDQAGSAEADDAFKGQLADRLRGRLSVKEVKGTQLVDLTYTSNYPDLAMEIANAYASAFIEFGKSERRESASSASGFLSEEIDTLKKEIAEREALLQQYSQDTNLLNVDPASNDTLQRLDGVNGDYISAKSRRIQAEAIYNQVLRAPKEAIADPLSGGVVAELRGDLSTKEREYATKLKTYKPTFPAMVQLESEIAELRSELGKVVDEMAKKAVDTARAEFQTAKRAEVSLENELQNLRTESLQVNSAAVEYRNLKSEIDNRRTLLGDLQRERSETDVAVRGSDQSTIRQVDRALLPGSPSAPNLRRSLAMGGVAGMLFGLAIAFLLEILDRTVKTPEELEKRTQLPTLAVIPDMASGGRSYGYGRFMGGRVAYGYDEKANKKSRGEVDIELVPIKAPRLAVSEAYRSLRTALLLSSASEVRVIGVTSCSAGEGKTSTATNLAVVMAQLGKRVLLIDADMRKPRCHRVLGVSNRIGLVNFLVGRSELSECFLETKIKNLSLCPSGPTPPNPSELISSERMRYLVQQARGKFDVVIIDSPPAFAVTDPTLVGTLADGMVLCVRAGRTPRDAVRTCRDRLQQSGVRILGTVLNAFRAQRGSQYKSYSYHYEAYGEYTKRDKEGAVA